jgi:hypothetical protein
VRRPAALVTAILSVALLAYALHARCWWSLDADDMRIRIGLRTIESCAGRLDADYRCKVVSFRSTVPQGTRQRLFMSLGSLTYIIGLGALAAVAISAAVARVAGAAAGPLARLAVAICGLAALAAASFVLSWPEGQSGLDIHLGIGLPLTLAGCGLGIWSGVATVSEARAALAAARLSVVAGMAGGPGMAGRPAIASAPVSRPAPGRASAASSPPPAPTYPPGRPAPRPLDLRVRRPRPALSPLALGPPCSRCSAPTRWTPQQRWSCDHCHL